MIDDPAAAGAALDPTRAAILGSLTEAGSASSVAAALGLTRQKVNYHLRTLEAHGLVELVEERPRRGLTERIVVASASSYVLAPDVLGPTAARPERVDRLSSRYLIAVAGRLISEVGALARAARKAGRPLATLTIDTEIRFADARARSEFTRELADSIAELCARHHDETSADGRWHRVVLAAHPRPNSE